MNHWQLLCISIMSIVHYVLKNVHTSALMEYTITGTKTVTMDMLEHRGDHCLNNMNSITNQC